MTTLLVLVSLLTAIFLIVMSLWFPVLVDVVVISRRLWRERPRYRAPRPRFLGRPR